MGLFYVLLRTVHLMKRYFWDTRYSLPSLCLSISSTKEEALSATHKEPTICGSTFVTVRVRTCASIPAAHFKRLPPGSALQCYPLNPDPSGQHSLAVPRRTFQPLATFSDVWYRSHTAVRSQDSPCRKRGGQSGTGTRFSPITFVFHCQQHSVKIRLSVTDQ
jgi:hypothetical protein